MGSSDIRILVVDDDEDLRATLVDFITRLGVKVRSAATFGEACVAIRSDAAPFEIILTDLKLPDGSGLDIVQVAHARSPECLVTILTGFASLDTAIEAIRLGAYDYITKPFSLDEIGVQVRNMIERVSLSQENARLSVRLQELYAQVNRLQSDRSDMMALFQEIRGELVENGRKLDALVGAGQRPAPSQPDRAAFRNLFRELDKLERLRGTSSVSPLELEERKRGLIEEFVGRL
jgi:DNA-binding NtrC family response regulator